MIAYIPARGGSKRIKKKNIRYLDGKPIIGHVIDNIKNLDFLSAVYVSTDDDEIAHISESFGATVLATRSRDLSNDNAGFADLIRLDLPRHIADNDGDSEILFVLATAALVPPSVFLSAFDVYTAQNPEILMSCQYYSEPPWWALIQKNDGYWEPIYKDKVTVNSQDLPETITDAGLFYFFDQSVMASYDCHKNSKRLLPFFVPFQYQCDVNSEEDWFLLEWKLDRLKKYETKL